MDSNISALGILPAFTRVNLLVTRRGTLLTETGLLHDYFGNFFTQDER